MRIPTYFKLWTPSPTKISNRIFALCLDRNYESTTKIDFSQFFLVNTDSSNVIKDRKCWTIGYYELSFLPQSPFYSISFNIHFTNKTFFSLLSFYSSKILRIRYSFNLNWIVFTYVNWIEYANVILPFYDVKCGRRKWTKKAEKLYVRRPLLVQCQYFLSILLFCKKVDS